MKLGDMCLKIGSGATPRGGKEVYLANGGAAALIRSQNVYNDRFERNGLAYILPEHAEQLQNVEVKSGDVLLNITGDSVARACQVPDDVLPARVNQHVAIIRPDPSQLDARFLRFFLISPQMQAHMLALAGAGATRNALTKGMIEGFVLPTIPIPEQRSIGGVLGLLEDKIELNRRMNETLEAVARALFKDWFVNFGPINAKAEGQPAYLAEEIWNLFPDTFSDIGVPTSWRIGELQEIVELNPRESLPSGSVAPYLEMAALPTSGSVSDPPVNRKFTSGTRFRNGDTLLARITPCLENGKAAFVQNLPVNTVGWGSTEFIVMRPLPPVTRAYAYILARDREFRARAIQSMTGTSGRQRARNEVLARHPVAIPDDAVWAAFSSIVEPIFDRIRALDLEMRTLGRLRDLLLPRLMSREIRLKDAEAEIGEAL